MAPGAYMHHRAPGAIQHSGSRQLSLKTSQNTVLLEQYSLKFFLKKWPREYHEWRLFRIVQSRLNLKTYRCRTKNISETLEWSCFIFLYIFLLIKIIKCEIIFSTIGLKTIDPLPNQILCFSVLANQIHGLLSYSRPWKINSNFNSDFYTISKVYFSQNIALWLQFRFFLWLKFRFFWSVVSKSTEKKNEKSYLRAYLYIPQVQNKPYFTGQT